MTAQVFHYDGAIVIIVGVLFTTDALTLRRAAVIESDTVLVLGANGSVGSAVVQVAKLKGCKVVDLLQDPNLQKLQTRPTVVIDTVGNLDLMHSALAVLQDCGRYLFISAPRQGSTELTIDITDLYRRQLELLGYSSVEYTQEEMTKHLADMVEPFETHKLQAAAEQDLTLKNVQEAAQEYLTIEAKRPIIVLDE